MADMEWSEFVKRVGGDESAAARQPADGAAAAVDETTNAPAEPFTLLPATEAQVQRAGEQLAASRIANMGRPEDAETASLRRLGVREGVPFDPETGVPFIKRLRLAFQPTPEEEVKALESAYGQGNVRRNEYGWLIVTKPGEDGRPTDVLVDPVGVDIGDLSKMIAQLPEIVGGGLALKGAKAAKGLVGAAKTLLKMAGGSEAAGAIKDVITRGAEGAEAESLGQPRPPMQLGEIAQRRGEMAVKDVAYGAAIGVGAKLGSLFVSPFSSAGALQFNARAASEMLGNKHGVKLPLSPAEVTGSSFLQRAEAMESQKPGASVAFEKMWKAREQELTRLQNIILGGGAPAEEAAGQRALAALGAKTAPLARNVERAAVEAGEMAEQELKAGIGVGVDKVQLGNAVTLGAKARKSMFDMVNQANYDAFYSNPLAKDPVIGGGALKREVDAMLKDLPKVRKQVQQSTGVLLPSGGQATTTVQKDIPVETPVRPRLEELSSKLAGGKVSINDLKQIRTDVDNAIKTGEAVPGVKEGRLKRLYSALTDAIEQGLKDINDPQLTAAWKKATDYYSANVGKFEKAGIAELFRDPINALGPNEVVERAARSPDTYAAYKEFFGAGSPQVKGLQQAIRDETLGLSDLSPSVSAAAFIKRLEDMPKEVRADVFGAGAEKLRASAQALRASGGESLPSNELLAMMRSGNASAQKVEQMLSAEAAKSQAYRNELVKAVSEGNLKPDSIRPTEFVNRLVFKKTTQPQDVRDVMAMLTDRPDVQEDIRRLAFKKALDDATFVNKQTGRRVLSAEDLENMLADENMAKRLQSTLGPSTFQDLTLIKDYLKPGAMVQQAAKSAGGLSTGQQVAGLVERGALKYVDRAVKNFFLATVYSAPPIKNYVSNTLVNEQNKSAVVNYVMASTPFLEALARTYTAEEGRKVARALKDSVDRFARESGDAGTGAVNTSQPGQMDWNQFLQRVGAGEQPAINQPQP